MDIRCLYDKLVPTSQLSPHPKFSSILIGKDGNILSSKTNRPRRLWKTRHGYMQLSVGRTSYLAHRLVADVWVPNPERKPEINHKNGIKDDNRAENLEWVTRRENIIHAREALKVEFNKPGLDNSNARVTAKESRMIAKLYNNGLTLSELSEVFEYAIPTISAKIRSYRMGGDRKTSSQPKKPK